MNKVILSVGLTACLFFLSCNKDDDNPDDTVKVDCNTKNITLGTELTDTSCGSEEGKISVTATGAKGAVQYKLDEGAFQNSGDFTGLKPGIYKITAQDADECAAVATVHIKSGISFENSIKPIIDANCAVSGCHVSGTARSDLSKFENIKQRAATIKSLTQSKAMPKNGSLTEQEIQQIACWVEDGALNN